MSTAELALVAILSGALAIVSAIAGVMWNRARSTPALRANALARDLVERLRHLDGLIDRLERPAATRCEVPIETHPVAATSSREPAIERRPVAAEVRVDLRSRPTPSSTLIAVPDLSAPAATTATAEAELAGRFGAIWDLADRGASSEAITHATGLPVGQVELILGLRRRSASVSEPA